MIPISSGRARGLAQRYASLRRSQGLRRSQVLIAATLATFLTVQAGAKPPATKPPPAPKLQGTWRITRLLPTSNRGCWSKERATPLVGTTLSYRAGSMSWKGGDIAVQEVTSRTVTDAEFRKESSDDKPATFQQLGIPAHSVLELNMQHEDMDITGSSTEVPGDSVLLATPNRIVVSACGVYMEAVKAAEKPKPRRR